MYKYILFLTLIFYSCIGAGDLEIKQFQLEKVIEDRVYLYEFGLDKIIVVKYRYDLFRVSKEDLYKLQFRHPIFNFYKISGTLYSI